MRTPGRLCVPITSSASCDQPIFVDHAIDVSLSSDAVQVEVGLALSAARPDPVGLDYLIAPRSARLLHLAWSAD
jgi:hypothetical protein